MGMAQFTKGLALLITWSYAIDGAFQKVEHFAHIAGLIGKGAQIGIFLLNLSPSICSLQGHLTLCGWSVGSGTNASTDPGGTP